MPDRFPGPHIQVLEIPLKDVGIGACDVCPLLQKVNRSDDDLPRHPKLFLHTITVAQLLHLSRPLHDAWHSAVPVEPGSQNFLSESRVGIGIPNRRIQQVDEEGLGGRHDYLAFCSR
jgi:hypothetical protein